MTGAFGKHVSVFGTIDGNGPDRAVFFVENGVVGHAPLTCLRFVQGRFQSVPYPRWCLRPKTYLTVVRIIINVSLFTLVYLTVFGYPPVRIGDALRFERFFQSTDFGTDFRLAGSRLAVVPCLEERPHKKRLTRSVRLAGREFHCPDESITWEVLVWASMTQKSNIGATRSRRANDTSRIALSPA